MNSSPSCKWEVYLRDMSSPMYVVADRINMDGNFSFVLDGKVMLLVAGSELVYMKRGREE